jgi:hypothetical protein
MNALEKALRKQDQYCIQFLEAWMTRLEQQIKMQEEVMDAAVRWYAAGSDQTTTGKELRKVLRKWADINGDFKLG